MEGRELLDRIIRTIQEMCIKIGKPQGAVTLYYPYDDDFDELESDFNRVSALEYPSISLEYSDYTVRVLIPEEDCIRISRIPPTQTMKEVTELVAARASIDDIRRFATEKYPEALFRRWNGIDFDWILMFPEEIDSYVYCLSEELGQLTFHRLTRDEFIAMDLGIDFNSIDIFN